MIPGLILCIVQNHAITIPCGTYSLQEVARLISEPGQEITVETTMKERGLLIALHNRSRRDAVEIVCNALDLKAVKAGRERLRLEADPTLAVRDRKWRTALLKNLKQRWTIQRDRFLKLAEMTPEQLNVARRDTKLGKDPFSGDVGTQINMLTTGGAPAQAACQFAASVSAELRDELLVNEIQRDDTNASISTDLADQVQKKMALVGPLRDPIMLQRSFARWPGMLVINSAVFATGRDGKWASLPYPDALMSVSGAQTRNPTRRLFITLASSKNVQVPGLGEDASNWLIESQKQTKKQLDDPTLADEILVPARDESLSGLVDLWAKENNRDVVMELAPIAESLDFGSGSPPSSVKTSLSRFMSMDEDWGLDSVDGVLVVRDRMAFLDRRSPCALGSIASYIRRNPTRDGSGPLSLDQIDSRPDLPEVDQLIPLIRLYYDQLPIHCRWLGTGRYHGLSEQCLIEASPLLWPGLPNSIHDRIRAEPNGEAQVPLSQFDLSAIREYAATFADNEDRNPQSPQFLDQFSNAVIKVMWKHRQNGEIAISFTPFGLSDNISNSTSVSMFQVKP